MPNGSPWIMPLNLWSNMVEIQIMVRKRKNRQEVCCARHHCFAVYMCYVIFEIQNTCWSTILELRAPPPHEYGFVYTRRRYDDEVAEMFDYCQMFSLSVCVSYPNVSTFSVLFWLVFCSVWVRSLYIANLYWSNAADMDAGFTMFLWVLGVDPTSTSWISHLFWRRNRWLLLNVAHLFAVTYRLLEKYDMTRRLGTFTTSSEENEGYMKPRNRHIA